MAAVAVIGIHHRGNHRPRDFRPHGGSRSRWHPDRDGIPNLLEYAFALEPRTASRAGLPVGGTASLGGKTYATLSFAKPRALTDLTYTVQVSADLMVWNSGSAHAVRADDASTDQATFREVNAIDDTSPHFMRLQVAQQ